MAGTAVTAAPLPVTAAMVALVGPAESERTVWSVFSHTPIHPIFTQTMVEMEHPDSLVAKVVPAATGAMPAQVDKMAAAERVEMAVRAALVALVKTVSLAFGIRISHRIFPALVATAERVVAGEQPVSVARPAPGAWEEAPVQLAPAALAGAAGLGAWAQPESMVSVGAVQMAVQEARAEPEAVGVPTGSTAAAATVAVAATVRKGRWAKPGSCKARYANRRPARRAGARHNRHSQSPPVREVVVEPAARAATLAQPEQAGPGAHLVTGEPAGRAAQVAQAAHPQIHLQDGISTARTGVPVAPEVLAEPVAMDCPAA